MPKLNYNPPAAAVEEFLKDLNKICNKHHIQIDWEGEDPYLAAFDADSEIEYDWYDAYVLEYKYKEKGKK